MLMFINQRISEIPLYMEAVMNILRSMEDNFDYELFRQKLSGPIFNDGQKAMLNLRLALLDSCLKRGDASNRVSNHFQKGQLTIIEYVVEKLQSVVFLLFPI